MKALKFIGVVAVIVLIFLGLSLLRDVETPAVSACAAAYVLPLLGILAKVIK